VGQLYSEERRWDDVSKESLPLAFKSERRPLHRAPLFESIRL